MRRIHVQPVTDSTALQCAMPMRLVLVQSHRIIHIDGDVLLTFELGYQMLIE